MPTVEDIALELSVFKLVDHSIDRDTYDLVFKTRTTNGFEDTTIISSNNPDYHKIVALIARKYNDTLSDKLTPSTVAEITTNKGGTSTNSLPEEHAIIEYDSVFECYMHNGNTIRDLEKFIATCLKLNYKIEIRSML